MNILFLTRTDPNRVAIGGEQRTHLLHKALQSCGTVYTAIPVFRQMQVRTEADRRIAWVYLERRGSLLWLARNFCLRFMPWIALPSSKPFRPPAEWAGIRFDAVVARHASLAAYFQAWTIAPLFVDADDLPVEWFDTLSRSKGLGCLNRLWGALVRKWSDRVFSRAIHVWVSRPDQIAMLSACKSSSVLPNIPLRSGDALPVTNGQEAILLTVGSLFHPPNYLGIQRFLDESWPTIHRAFPDLHYVIVGGNCPAKYAVRWKQVAGVEVAGYVEDLAACYQRALCTVAPVFQGSGTCIKVLESLAMGRGCLGPAFAMRGISAADQVAENGIFVCETAEDYVRALGRLMDIPFRRALAARAWSFVRTRWNQEAIERELASTFAQVKWMKDG